MAESQELTPVDAMLPAISGGTQNVMSVLDSILPPTTDTGIMQELSPFIGWLPFVILLQPASPFCGPPHRIPQGSFLCRKSKTDLIALDDAVDILPIDWRAKAMKPASDKPDSKKMKIIFDRTDPEFIEIQNMCKAKAKGYFWGYEFLLYLPDHGIFATFFCNNPTLQNAARAELINFMRKPCTLKSALIEKEDFRWFGFTVIGCQSPFQIPLDPEQVREIHKRFRDQADLKVEEVSTEEPETASPDTRER